MPYRGPTDKMHSSGICAPLSLVLTKITKIDPGLGFEFLVSRIRRTTTTWWRLHKLAKRRRITSDKNPSLSHAVRQILFSAFECGTVPPLHPHQA